MLPLHAAQTKPNQTQERKRQILTTDSTRYYALETGLSAQARAPARAGLRRGAPTPPPSRGRPRCGAAGTRAAGAPPGRRHHPRTTRLSWERQRDKKRRRTSTGLRRRREGSSRRPAVVAPGNRRAGRSSEDPRTGSCWRTGCSECTAVANPAKRENTSGFVRELVTCF